MWLGTDKLERLIYCPKNSRSPWTWNREGSHFIGLSQPEGSTRDEVGVLNMSVLGNGLLEFSCHLMLLTDALNTRRICSCWFSTFQFPTLQMKTIREHVHVFRDPTNLN